MQPKADEQLQEPDCSNTWWVYCRGDKVEAVAVTDG